MDHFKSSMNEITCNGKLTASGSTKFSVTKTISLKQRLKLKNCSQYEYLAQSVMMFGMMLYWPHRDKPSQGNAWSHHNWVITGKIGLSGWTSLDEIWLGGYSWTLGLADLTSHGEKGCHLSGAWMLKPMLVKKNFLTWLLIGWWLCHQPIQCQVWKS